MPNLISTSDFSQPTLAEIEDKTYFVHATESFPATGQLIAGAKVRAISAEAYSKQRQTIHFAMGSVIPAAISSGDRTAYPYALIVPFKSLKTQLAEVSFLDSYIIGDLPFDNTMFLIMPEDVVLTKEIIESNINVVTYNPAIEGIKEISKKVIQKEKGWVTRIEHKDFELYAPVFIEEEGKNSLVDNFNFFNPLLEKYQQLSVSGNDVHFIKGNQNSKLLPVFSNYLSKFQSDIFNPIDMQKNMHIIDYLFTPLRAYLTKYFPHSNTLTIFNEEKDKLYTVANYWLEIGKYISLPHGVEQLNFINAATSKANLIEYIKKKNLKYRDFSSTNNKVIDFSPAFPFFELPAFIEYSYNAGFTLNKQDIDVCFITNEIIQLGNASSPLEESRLVFSIRQILKENFSIFFSENHAFIDLISSALTLPFEKFSLFINLPEIGFIFESRGNLIPNRAEEIVVFRQKFALGVAERRLPFVDKRNERDIKFDPNGRFTRLIDEEKVHFLNALAEQYTTGCSQCDTYFNSEGSRSVFALRKAILNNLFDNSQPLERVISLFFAETPSHKQIIIKDRGSSFTRLFVKKDTWYDIINRHVPNIFESPSPGISHVKSTSYPQPSDFDEAVNYFFDSQRASWEKQRFYKDSIIESFKTLNDQQAYLQLTELDRQSELSNLGPEWSTQMQLLRSEVLDSFDTSRFDSVALLSLKKCLPDASAGASGSTRRKREALAECEITWEDIEEFNEEKDQSREFNKIKINSEQFLESLKNPEMSETKRAQLLQLADKAVVTGGAKGQVTGLVNHQKNLRYLSRVGHISDSVMKGMMAKNIARDFLHGNYEGVAINLGLIGGGMLGEKMASNVAKIGEKLEVGREVALFRLLKPESRVLLGKFLKCSSHILARLTSGVIVYDLVNQINAYKQGNPDALVGIVGDSIYLDTDVATIGIGIAEELGFLEGVSAYAGPIGATIGVVVFVGTDIYLSVKQVGREDVLLHLTITEKFLEGMRAFIGMDLDLKNIMEKKKGNNELYAQAIAFLKNNTKIQRYVLPTVKAVEVCGIVRKQQCSNLGGTVMSAGCTEWNETVCNSQLEMNSDNAVFLEYKSSGLKWSRTKPEAVEGILFCAPTGGYEEVPNDGAYRCDNAMGIEYSQSRRGNITLVDLGDGVDRVVGFPYGDHIVKLGGGYKDIRLGEGHHIVQLNGEMEGVLKSRGVITLDLQSFAPNRHSMYVQLKNNSCFISSDPLPEDASEDAAIITSRHSAKAPSIEATINNILLRSKKQDSLRIACNTHHVDTGGGKDLANQDSITIPKASFKCPYNSQFVVRPYTEIINNNTDSDSRFTYSVPTANKGEASINLGDNIGSHQVVFNYTLYDINKLEKVGNVTSFHFIKEVDQRSKDEGFTLRMTYAAQGNVSYILSDQTEIKVGEKGFYALQRTTQTLSRIIHHYPSIARRLNLFIFVHLLLKNESIAIGHGHHDVLHNDPHSRSHLVGHGGENIFVITSGYEVLDKTKLPLPEVVIYDMDDENLIDTLDLRGIKNQLEKDLAIKVELRINLIPYSGDIGIELSSAGYAARSFMMIRLKHAFMTHWYKRLHVILNHAPMEFDELDLKPVPLTFGPDKNILVISAEDVEENTRLVIPKKSGNYRFLRLADNLLMSNVLYSNLTANERYSIFLQNFYRMPKLETLSIRFADKELVLKNEMAKIANASDFSVAYEQYRRSLHGGFLNEALAQANIIPVSHYKLEPQSLEQAAHYEAIDKKEQSKNTQEIIWAYTPYLLSMVGAMLGAGMGYRYQARRRLLASIIPATVAQAAVVSPLLSATTADAKPIEKNPSAYLSELASLNYQENHSEPNNSNITWDFEVNSVANISLLKWFCSLLGWNSAVTRMHRAEIVLANTHNDTSSALEVAEQRVIKAIATCDIAFDTNELSSVFFEKKKTLMNKPNQLSWRSKENRPTFSGLGSIWASTSNDARIPISSTEAPRAIK